MSRGFEDQRRTTAIVLASFLGHAGLLAYLGLREVDLRAPIGMSRPDPVVYLQIEPRPLMPGETAPVPVQRDRQVVASPLRPASPLARRDPVTRLPDEEEDVSVGPPAPDPGWSVRPRTLGDSIARGLRTRGVGCADPAMLSAAERAICEDRFGRRAAGAAPIAGTGNRERDALFAAEGASRIADYERRRRGLSGRPGVTLPDDCGGSNLGFSCAGGHLRPEFRQDRDSTLNQVLGADRGDPTAPRLPRAGGSGD